jgi:acyl-coenzyme A synthetase/AMP-(fatty) acid ligase
VAVAATPDNIRGEEVLACVVAHETPAPGAREELAADIVRTALEEISYFKVPGYVMFVDALPLTATQKIQRGALKALARELPGTPGCIDTRRLKRQARPGP